MIALLAVTGCAVGCAAPGSSAAQQAAVAFTRAVTAKDGARACAVLAPGTRSELEQSEGKKCSEAVLSLGLHPAGAPGRTRVFGTAAQVKFTSDTMFLGRFRSGWRVVAAGCKPVPGHPYDCLLQGG